MLFSTSAGVAVAQPPTLPAVAQSSRPLPDSDRASASPSATPSNVHAHDGFYLRFGLGFGAFTDAMAARDEDSDGEIDEGTITGIGSTGELMLGGAVSRQVIVGGGLWTSSTFVTSYANSNDDGIPTDLRQPDNFTIVGPFADWYFSSRAFANSPGGFHAQAGLGLSVLNGFRPEQARHDDRRVAVGPGLMLGFGYEWWVSEQWAIGALARLTAAGLVEKDTRDDYWYHGVATFPAFLFTGTYN
jgi:hypothetical protein